MKRFSFLFLSIAFLGKGLSAEQNVSASSTGTTPAPPPLSVSTPHSQIPPFHPGTRVPSGVTGSGSPMAVEKTDQSHIIDEVIRNQFDALKEGDPSRAYYAYGSEEFKRNVSLETFTRFIKTNRILIMNRTIKIEKPEFDGVAAKVKVRLGNGSETSRVDFELVLENGAWKINRLEILRNGF